jgi:abhydrolase domain-containing protein 12
MPSNWHPLVWTGISAVAGPVALYSLFIGLSMTPFFQRHFVYAHRIHTLWWTNLDEPETWGFASNQVTPFFLQTPDAETIYAWHIMPLPLYLQHESTLSIQEPASSSKNFTTTDSFRLLKEDPDARLVLYFHGNAGHVAQANRPDSYHALTDTSSYHVIAFDYRGFGRSTGVPSEAGLVDDASAVVDWAIKVAKVHPSRIVLLGQSLGTAVASGVAERYALDGIEFAGVVLVAGFSDLSTMLDEYRIGGIFPVLSPLKFIPGVSNLVRTFVVDKWKTAGRLANLVRHTKSRLRLTLIHAKNDADIPWTEDNKMFRAAVDEKVGITDDDEFIEWKNQLTVKKGNGGFVTTWTAEPNTIIRQELFPYGGHNSIMGFAPVALAIMRSFELHGTGYVDEERP